MIIRVEHKKRFTVITDQALRDPEISLRATGLLAYLLSLPDGTEISGVRVVEAKPEGRDAIYAAMKELENRGYIIREKHQDPQSGRWFTVCTVRELPPGNQPPITGFQKSVTRQSVNQESKAFNTNYEYQLRDASLENRTATPTRMPDELRRHLPHRDTTEQPAEEAAS